MAPLKSPRIPAINPRPMKLHFSVLNATITKRIEPPIIVQNAMYASKTMIIIVSSLANASEEGIFAASGPQ